MKRTAIPILTLLALVPAVAHAAFPGRNGVIVYVRGGEDVVYDEDSGDVFLKRLSLVVRMPGDHERVLAHCTQALDVTCAPWLYGDPALSPDSRLVAVRVADQLALVEVGGGELREIPHPSGSNDAPAFSPSGRRLAFENSYDEMAPTVWISDLDGGRANRVITVSEGRDPAWSARNWIAFGDENGGISRVRPDGRGLRPLVGRGERPAWSPDGRRLAFTGFHRPGHGLFVTDGLGRHIERIGLHGRPYDVAWSPDGRKIDWQPLPRR